MNIPSSSFSLVVKPDETNLSIESETKLDYLIDITVAYPDGGEPLDVLSILNGIRPPCDTHLYYRIYPIKQVRRRVLLIYCNIHSLPVLIMIRHIKCPTPLSTIT